MVKILQSKNEVKCKEQPYLQNMYNFPKTWKRYKSEKLNRHKYNRSTEII